MKNDNFRITKMLGLLAGSMMLFTLAPRQLAVAQGNRPNIVVILADDLGFGDLGCYGHPHFKTPRLDRMAAEGAKLTRFNTPTPYCAPTRASLLTGRYPIRCGMPDNPTPDGEPSRDLLALPKTEITLANLLRSAGYATSIVGKWHLGHHEGFLPTDRGFDEYFGIPYSNDMRPVKLLEGTDTFEYPVVQTTLTQRYTARAVSFIQRNKNKPFFLYFPQVMPHKPLAVSEANYKKSGHGLYGDVMLDLDASVGQVLDALKENGLDEQTLVLFTSDNGAWFGGSTGGLRGMKGSTCEGGYRVPMIARWPGRIPPGHVSDQPAVMMDLFATIVAATGVKIPDTRTIDGRDIMPLFTNQAVSPHEYLFGLRGDQIANVRNGNWKLHLLPPTDAFVKKEVVAKWVDHRAPDGVTILAPYEQYGPDAHPGTTGGDPPAAMQLFDLASDPNEQHNLAADHAELVARLRQIGEQAEREMKAERESLAKSR